MGGGSAYCLVLAALPAGHPGCGVFTCRARYRPAATGVISVHQPSPTSTGALLRVTGRVTGPDSRVTFGAPLPSLHIYIYISSSSLLFITIYVYVSLDFVTSTFRAMGRNHIASTPVEAIAIPTTLRCTLHLWSTRDIRS